MGRCTSCGEFNTLAKRLDEDSSGEPVRKMHITPLSSVKSLERTRKATGIHEFDRVLGGGLIPGAVILLTGEPGVGKSTLLLQSLSNMKTLYISGEEAPEQVKDRADRLKISLKSCYFSSELQVESIAAAADEWSGKLDVMVVDSIQTIYSKAVEAPPGTVSQLREATNKLIAAAKKYKIPMIVIGHVTKEGDVAGPKTLEHMVDAVLNLEGEKVSQFRVLRASKNRFGSTDEIGVFEMKQGGMSEVNNPLAFLEGHEENVPGKAIVGITEGKRPLFFEIQTLATPTVLAIPRRIVKGVDYNKLLLLLAVIRKHLNIPLEQFDIYVNVIGGVDIRSTAADLGIIASVVSSMKNVSAPATVFVGEVGLLGEIRNTYGDEKVLAEAKRLKFRTVYSKKNMKSIKEIKNIFYSRT